MFTCLLYTLVYFSFTVPAFTTAYSVMVSNCQGNGSDCTVTMTASESLAAQDSSSSSVDCRQQGPRCLLAMASPLTESEHFVTFSLDAGHGSQDIVFDVTFEIQGRVFCFVLFGCFILLL